MNFIKIAMIAVSSILILPTLVLAESATATHNEYHDLRVYENLVDGPLKYHDSGLPIDTVILGDSGVRYSPYKTMEADLTALAQKYPKQAQLIHYGSSLGGRNLNVLRIEDKTVTSSLSSTSSNCERPAIQISGAIHGNEFLGIEDKLAAYFLNSKDQMPGLSLFLANGGVIYVIPVVNPDGFEQRRRANNNSVDLNRDFDLLPKNDLRFTQPESKALAQFLDTDLSNNKLHLKFALDYHCCVPAMITPWSYADILPSGQDLETYDSVSKMQKSILGYETGNPVQTVGYTADGTTMDYFYAKYGTIGVAVEGNYRGEMDSFQKHIQMWDNIFQQVAEKHWGYNSDSTHQCK